MQVTREIKVVLSHKDVYEMIAEQLAEQEDIFLGRSDVMILIVENTPIHSDKDDPLVEVRCSSSS